MGIFLRREEVLGFHFFFLFSSSSSSFFTGCTVKYGYEKGYCSCFFWIVVMQDTERSKKKQKASIGKDKEIETMRDFFSLLSIVPVTQGQTSGAKLGGKRVSAGGFLWRP